MAGKTFKPYDFTLAAGGSQVILAEGEYFRVQSATGALDVTVEGAGTLPGLLSGQAMKDTPFKRLVLRDASGAPNSGTILVASQEFVDNRLYGVVTLGSAVTLDAATLAALETIDLGATTLAALEQISVRPEVRSGSYEALADLAANTPVTIFDAATNANGAILLDAFGSGHSAGAPVQPTFIAKATAPATVIDGEVIYSAPCVGYGGGTWVCAGDMPEARYIPAGRGLYFIVTDPATYCMRHCRYKLL